jgi:hypothetical protein
MNKKSMLVLIYPYKFTKFIWNLYELNAIENYCDILVLDLSVFLGAEFANKTANKRLKGGNIILVKTVRNFIKEIYRLKNYSISNNVCILNQIPKYSFKELCCHLIMFSFLNKSSIRVFETFNGGIPIYRNPRFDKLGSYNKLWSYVVAIKSFSEVIRKIKIFIPFILGKYIRSNTTHILYAGDDWLRLAMDTYGDSVNYIPGHSNDYSNTRLNQTIVGYGRTSNTSVLLDAPSPMFVTDALSLGRKTHLTSEVWYPKLSSFLDIVEEETGVSTVIASHPMSDFSGIEECFGHRRVICNQTSKKVRECQFVITRSSTAISFAVIFNKPVIFIYSNQLKKDKYAMENIFNKAEMLGATPVNIDDTLFDFKKLLQIDSEKYNLYKARCLSSEISNLPNSKIIIRDIMGIEVS